MLRVYLNGNVYQNDCDSTHIASKTYIFRNEYLPTVARPESTSLSDDDTAEVTFPRERHLQLICLFMLLSGMERFCVCICYISRSRREPL